MVAIDRILLRLELAALRRVCRRQGHLPWFQVVWGSPGLSISATTPCWRCGDTVAVEWPAPPTARHLTAVTDGGNGEDLAELPNTSDGRHLHVVRP